MSNRRDFLRLSAAGMMALGLPAPLGRARANPLASGRLKFLWVFAAGGWDPTRVFAAEFDNPAVDMEPDAERAELGDLRWVSHAERPSVDGFMAAHAERLAIVNGLMVRSISHEICTLIQMTGTTASGSPDWPAILAAAEREAYILPHLVVAGPSFPGELGVAVARTGASGQLEALLSGEVFASLDRQVAGPSSPAEGILDRYMARRLAARAEAGRSALDRALTGDLLRSFDQAARLKQMQYLLDLSPSADLGGQAEVAVNALASGVSRCVTLEHVGADTGWDTHADNDAQQSVLWENLFSGLSQLMALLDATPGEEAPSLAEETVVVVVSEMGRTPQLNALEGKDHWPYTSAMLLGPTVAGGRVYGGFDDGYYGRPVDTASGEVDEGGQVLSAEALGATLLAMADLDPADHILGVQPIEGMRT